MTRQEQRIAEAKAQNQRKLDALKHRDKILDAQQAALEHRRRERRLMEVGRLVETLGLLWESDDRLEKILLWGRERLEVSPPRTALPQ